MDINNFYLTALDSFASMPVLSLLWHISWTALPLFLPVSFGAPLLLLLYTVSKWLLHPHFFIQFFLNAWHFWGSCVVTQYLNFYMSLFLNTSGGYLCYQNSVCLLYYVRFAAFFVCIKFNILCPCTCNVFSQHNTWLLAISCLLDFLAFCCFLCIHIHFELLGSPSILLHSPILLSAYNTAVTILFYCAEVWISYLAPEVAISMCGTFLLQFHSMFG